MTSVFAGKVHVFGGTSDAVQLCQKLQSLGINYSLSVATDAGEQTATHLKGQVIVGRLDSEQMKELFNKQAITLVIDATHPYAAEVSKNIIKATEVNSIPLIRYERPTQIDLLEDPLLIKVLDIESACHAAKNYGENVFLTTGSKDLAKYKEYLPDKRLIVRVLPTVNVIQSCVELGLGLGDIVAMKGPFNQLINEAMYQFYQPDVVITKESGIEGGYAEKVLPCLKLNIPCIVISRPKQIYQRFVSNFDELEQQLKACK